MMASHELLQISVLLENRAGSLSSIAGTLQETDVNILAFSIAEAEGFGVVRLIVDDPAKACEHLRGAGFAVTETRMIALSMFDEPGGLYEISRMLGDLDVNMEYAYAFNRPGKGILVMRATDADDSLARIESRYPHFLEDCSDYQTC